MSMAQALKSDARIGRKAYLNPGGPFAGGTLARDIVTLTRLAGETSTPMRVVAAVKQSNDLHRKWAFRQAPR